MNNTQKNIPISTGKVSRGLSFWIIFLPFTYIIFSYYYSSFFSESFNPFFGRRLTILTVALPFTFWCIVHGVISIGLSSVITIIVNLGKASIKAKKIFQIFLSVAILVIVSIVYYSIFFGGIGIL